MMKVANWLILGVILSVPAVAIAQRDDAAYCKALSDKYQYFLTKPAGHSPRPGSIDGNVAVYRCQMGDTATSIPVLEQKLRDAKIELPARS
jgi:hypothetical protein